MAVKRYNGSDWDTVAGVGSQGATGATGASATTVVTTKGDLLTYSTTAARLGVGSNNQVLTADSAEATGLKWTTPAAGGKVLQVINATAGSYVATTSSTFSDTGLTATITPTSSSSKILVFVSQNGVSKENGNGQGRIRVMRGATQIISLGSLIAFTNNTDYSEIGSVSTTYLDSPATTSATTYKTQFATTAGSFAVHNYGTSGDGTAVSTITLMEIGA